MLADFFMLSNMSEYCTLRLKKDVKQELSQLGNLSSNYSDVIHNLIKNAKQVTQKEVTA